MKLPILLALCAVTAYATQSTVELERETQYAAYSEYTYEYKGQILSGLPEVSKEYAGLKIKANVKLQIHSQNRFLMQLRDVKLCKLHKEMDRPSEQQVVQPEDCQEDSFTLDVRRELEKRIEFYWTRGQISQISTMLTDQDWSVNIKRGVLELLQVNLEGNPDSKHLPKSTIQKKYYRVMEQGIAGECESIYNVKVHVSEPERKNNVMIPERDGLNVTKVRNYENCRDRPTRSQATIMKGVVCKDCETKDEQKLLTQVGQVRYNITGNRKLFIIDSVVAEGKHVFEPLGQKNGQAVTFVNQSLVRTESRKNPAAGDPEFILNLDQNDRKDQTEGLKFVFPEEKPRETIKKETHLVECQPMSKEHGLHGQIEQLLNNIVNGINEYVSEESLDQLQLLTQKLRGLNRTELCHCMNHFGQDLVNDNELNEKRRMILEDLLPLLGSLHSVEILYRRIESRRIVGHRAAELISGLSFQPNPDDQILDTVLDLCMSDAVNDEAQLKQTCWLTFGSLVNTACKDENRQRCPQIKQDRYMKALVAGIDRSRPEEERRMCLKAIGNAGIHFKNNTYNLLETVQEIARDDKDIESSPEIKAQAIYSLRRISSKRPEEIRTILSPIYRDHSIHHEVRIAAFVVIMDTQPDHLTIQMLAQVLQKETSRQVGNFVYSYFKGLAESKIPCKKNITIGAQEALKMAKKFENGLQYSKSYHWENSILRNKISAAINVNWLSTPESAYGIGGSTKLSAKMFGRNMNWLEWGYRSEHMEELVQRLVFKVKGVYPPINKKFKDQTARQQGLSSREIIMGEQSNDLNDLVKRIDTEVNVTERHPKTDPINASFFIKAFGQELRYLTLDKTTIEEILSGSNTALRDLEIELSANKPQVKYQKAFTIGEGWQLWPTTVGIPLSLNLTNSAIMAVHATGKVEMQPSLQQVLQDDAIKAKKIDISGVLNPRLGMLITGKLGVSLNHTMKAGVAYEGLINSSVVINGSLKLDVEKLKMESTFQPPQHNHTIVSLKGKPYTFSIKGEEMPKKYNPLTHGKKMLHMMRMTPEQLQKSTNQEKRKVITSKMPVQMKTEVGNKTVIAEVSANFSRIDNCFCKPTKCLLSGPTNISVILRPGLNRPEEIKVVGKISDWLVTPEQHEAHIRRSSRRQFLEPKDMKSSESGSRSFTSAERFQDVMMPGEFRNSKELKVPTAKPDSLEERRSKEKFDWDTAYWTKDDRRVVPLTAINGIQDSQQYQQQPECSQFIPLKQIFLNITAKGLVPQTELLTAITLDTRDYSYKALTVDIISETKKTAEEKRIEEEERIERELLRNDPLNTVKQARLNLLLRLEEARQQRKREDRMVMCVQGEVEFPDVKFKDQSPQDVLPHLLSDDTKVKYKLGVQYGKTCENDKKVQILARVEKSEQQRIDEALSSRGQRSDEERQCEQDRQRGEKYSWTCKQVSEQRSQLRALHVDVTSKVDRMTSRVTGMVGDAIFGLLDRWGRVKREDTINEQNKLSISIDQDKNCEKFNVSVKAALKNIKFVSKVPVKLPALYEPMKPVTKAIVEKVLTQAKPRCKVTSLNKVITFDNITYDYELSKCHHILAKDCSPSERFLVLARKKDEYGPEKETIIHLAGHKIEFRPDDVDGLHVYIDDVNQQMVSMDKLLMREDGTIEKKNVKACKKRTLMDVIRPDIEENGITSSEVYRILTHKERHRTPPPQGQATPRPYSHSASHGSSASKSKESISISMGSTSSEEVKMRQVEKETWKQIKELMMMTFEGRDQREIMQMLQIEDQLMMEDGSEVVLEQLTSRPLFKIFRTTRSVMLFDYRLGLFVKTCGENIKVEIARHFQDTVCGMCGHFNGEVQDELQGPSKEIYKEPKQFALSYQLQSVPQECAQECVPRVNIQTQDLRVDNVDSSCYSKVLVPRCRDTCRPVEIKRVKTDFVCISRDSGLKTQLDDSIQRQRPHEVVRTLSNKSPSFVEEIDVHTRCEVYDI